MVRIVATQIWQVTERLANDNNRGTSAGSWKMECIGAVACWNTVRKQRRHASFNRSSTLILPSTGTSGIGAVSKTCRSNGTTPRSIRASTCWSVPLAKEPSVTADSNLIRSPMVPDESPSSCKSRGTTPWAITEPFCLLLPITEFLRHLQGKTNLDSCPFHQQESKSFPSWKSNVREHKYGKV